jgi:hypothetical protein
MWAAISSLKLEGSVLDAFSARKTSRALSAPAIAT